MWDDTMADTVQGILEVEFERYAMEAPAPEAPALADNKAPTSIFDRVIRKAAVADTGISELQRFLEMKIYPTQTSNPLDWYKV